MAHSSHTFEDLSGASASASTNPYDGLIESCSNDPAEIQDRYITHREKRAIQQKDKLSSPDFAGVTIDPILLKLEDQAIEPGYRDPRNCLVFWARPPQAVKDLIAEVQRRLKPVAPRLWLMPPSSLHMTALEITHSLTAPEIDDFVSKLMPDVQAITDYTYTHRARIIKPMITYDAQALAISFLPAAGEALPSDRKAEDDKYSYHHLRRDLYNLASKTVTIGSRYVVPSAHLTIGRFIYADDFDTADGKVNTAKMAALVQTIDGINEWLKAEYWPKGQSGQVKAGGEWIVGQEKGLDFRKGALWYGGGQTVRLGKGF